MFVPLRTATSDAESVLQLDRGWLRARRGRAAHLNGDLIGCGLDAVQVGDVSRMKGLEGTRV
jgi:hypothetical protein